MRSVLVCLALALALPAVAATKFRVRVSVTGGAHAFTAGTITIDGSRVHLRVEELGDQPLLYDSAISLDKGRTWVAMNSELETHYQLERSPLTLHSRQLSPAIPEAAGAVVRVAKQRWEVQAGEGVARLSFVTHADMRGNRASARHAATVEMVGEPAVDATLWPGVRLFTTGLPSIDDLVGDGMPLQTFPRSITTRFSRRYEGGGAEFTETVVIDVENVQDGIEVSDSLFVIPSTWREQAPVIGVPGLAELRAMAASDPALPGSDAESHWTQNPNEYPNSISHSFIESSIC